jgi:acyl-CoA synthetase (AMP-forming)/AMP-acid ligase II
MLNTKMTLPQAFQQVAGSRLDQGALVCGEERLTYGQLLERIDGVAHSLSEIDISKGDKVVCLLPPGPEFICLFFAVAKLGGVFIPLNPRIRPRGFNDVLQEVKPAVIVSQHQLDEELTKQITGIRHLLFTGLERNGFNQTEQRLSEVFPEDLVALLFTSGTTGKPKGAMHSHRSLIAPVVASIKLRELWIKKPTLMSLGQSVKALARYRTRLLRAVGQPQTFLSTVGWHTITGLEVMLQALLMGDRLVVMPRFHPRKALQLIERESVTVLIAVPMALQVMLGVEGFEQFDTSSLLICGTGAAPCPPALAQEIQDRFGCAVHIGFGATETGGGIAATSIADSNDRQATTVGQPMPGMEIRIVDEHRRQLPPGQVGELACRSDSLMLGYFGAPEETAEVIDEDGWYYTGDLAMIDDNGYLRIVGRLKDIIIRGGQNIYPAEIESVLSSHAKIREVAVLGVPAPMGGEQVWAYLISESEEELTSSEVLAFCREELEPFKIPSRVVFVDDFPRSETGKPQKFILRDRALRLEEEANNNDELFPPKKYLV